MDTMKTYPHIGRTPRSAVTYIAFDKLDGSNVRVEWQRKKGFVKFGRRNGLLDDSHPLLKAKTPSLILDKYGDDLEAVFRAQRWDRATAYFEFAGPNSFAGTHDDEDDHSVTLFDVAVYRRGFLQPRDFLRLFGHVDHPAVLFEGRIGPEFRERVRTGALPGMTFEGVVCKGPHGRKPGPHMMKVKTDAWLDRLRVHCGDNEALFEKLR